MDAYTRDLLGQFKKEKKEAQEGALIRRTVLQREVALPWSDYDLMSNDIQQYPHQHYKYI